MTKKDAIKIFEDKKIRTVWDSEKEKWYFSIVVAREQLESRLGHSVISPLNAKAVIQLKSKEENNE